MIVYKVVHVVRGSGKMVSCSIHPKSIAIEYKIGEEIKPRVKNSPIFVFDSLRNAVLFARRIEEPRYKVTILECNTESARPGKKMMGTWGINHSRLAFKEITEYWLRQTLPSTVTPVGTMYADSVTPTKVVSYEEMYNAIEQYD